MSLDRRLVSADPMEEEAEASLRARVATEEEKTELSALVKMRGVQRARFTKKFKELETILGEPGPVEDLSLHWQEFDDIYAELRELNVKIGPLLVRCAVANYDDSMDRVAAYDKLYAVMTSRLRSSSSVAVSSPSEAPEAQPTQSFTCQSTAMRYKLPKFSGDIKRFREWWQLFRVHIHQKKMDPIEKFTWLKESLVGAPSYDIAHLEFNADQYEVAIDTIEKKYGCPRAAEREHIQELRKLCTSRELHNNDKFFRFVSSLSQNVRALLSLGKTFDSLSLAISQDVLQCLPRAMSEEFTRQNFKLLAAPGGSDSELKLLLDFLEKEVVIKRSCGTSGSPGPSSSQSARQSEKSGNNDGGRRFNQKPNSWRNKQEYSGSGSVAFLAKDTEVDHSCVFCASNRHESKACKKPLTYEEKKKLCDGSNACYRCLTRNHYAKKCRRRNVKCERCSRGHYAVMCNSERSAGQQTEAYSTQVVTSQPGGQARGLVCFQTGLLWVSGPSRREVFRFFIDSGSERSYISNHVIESLKLKPAYSEKLAMITIGGQVSQLKEHSVYEIGLQSRFDHKLAISLSATGLPEIARGNFAVAPESWDLSPLADHAENVQRREIDVLLGWDVIPKIKCGVEEIFDDRMVASKTIFGWVIAGTDKERSSDSQAQIFVTANLYQPGTKLRESQVISMTTLAATENDHLPDLPSGGAEASAEAVDEVDPSGSESLGAEPSPDITSDLQVLWSTDLLGIENPSADSGISVEAELEIFFKNNLSRMEDGRYMVRLPFKDNLRTLGDNENVARGSLKRVLYRALKDKELLAAIDQEMHQSIQRGYAEAAPAKKQGELVHYLPILPVVKRDPEKHLSKLRVVKDAGVRRKDEAALNDVVHDGANLLPDIFKVLLRFRRDEIAVVSDIEKAFRQYRIHPDHRTFLRFFWPLGISKNRGAPVREFWSTTLDFGISASPFIHCAGIRFHVRQLAREHAEKARLLSDIEQHFYMDDLVFTTESADEGFESFDFLFKAFGAGGFKLRKWATNCADLGRRMAESLSDPEVQVAFDQEDFKFLGMGWNLRTDQLHISVSAAVATLEGSRPSKRSVLRGAAQIFDPLGLISPLTIRPKILLQTLWKQKLDWDTELTGKNLEDFKETTESLRTAQQFRIQRSINTNADDIARELHVFCDSSLSALGCVAYVREISERGGAKVFLIASKARVVPLKSEYSIHKLELVGAVMAARLGTTIKKYLNFHFESTHYWCDNAATLHWIKDAPERWKVFVANRIKEIQALSSQSDWDYVASKDNPADLLSRGADVVSEEFSSMWLQGPPWLAHTGRPASEHALNRVFAKDVTAERKLACMLTTSSGSSMEPSLGARLSSWSTFVNSIAIALRWLAFRYAPVKQFASCAPVSADESHQATEKIIRVIQRAHFALEVEAKCRDIPKESKLFKLAPFVDDRGIIRCRSRLERSDELGYEEKFPTVLPGEVHAVRLLIRFYHERKCFHVGGVAATLGMLRKRFYILSARRAVKKVLRDCKVCMLFRVSAAAETVPPLPEFRVATAPAFSVCGVDYAGPIPYRTTQGVRAKGYFLLFVCAVTRAIHIQLVPDMTTYEFLLALRRFLSRYSATTRIISDNGLSFVKAAKELKIVYGHVGSPAVQGHLAAAEIVWEFTTPNAPWHGAWWERLVQCVKRPLRKILGRGALQFRELETVLAEIESMVNQRPLTSVQLDTNEVSALCPADLLYGHRAKPGLPETGSSPIGREAANAIVFSERWKQQQSVLRAFQKRFREEYLGYLRSAHIRPPAARRPIAVGDVCLLRDPDPSRAKWPLCRVLSLSGGERTDLRRRSCLIRMATGQVYNRPIQLLYPLEV